MHVAHSSALGARPASGTPAPSLTRRHAPAPTPAPLLRHPRPLGATPSPLPPSPSGTNPPPASPPPPAKQPPAVLLDDARTQAFMSWARGPASIKFSGVRPSTFGGVRGLAASADLAPERLLVEVPRRSALVLAPAARNGAPGLVTDAWWKGAPWFAKMGAMLIEQKRASGASPLGPWVAQLPQDPAVPALWSDQQVAALQYPHLIQLVREQQKEWRDLYDTLKREGVAAGASPPSREEFQWALAVVRSRTFSGPYIGSTLSDRLRLAGVVGALVAANTALGLADLATSASAALAVLVFNVLYELLLSQSLKQYAICPLIDLFNHSGTVQSEVSYNYFGDSYEVVAAREFKQGEQVFISYGAQSNDSLMQFYGFSEQDNPKDVYVLRDTARWLAAFPPAPLAPTRLAALRASSLGGALEQVVVQREGFPPEALQALRFLLAPEGEAAKGVAAFDKPGPPEAEALLAAALAHLVGAELGALGSSLQEDQALLAGAGPAEGKGKRRALSGPEAAAVAFRAEKKKVLAGVLSSLGA
ncbi:hypothetical protein HYH03_018920 [Edaphochlamys debaryana]|uniref:SET domain-containing protein n=1 Tax=Edaphochlamys debaryana TaxID=47281 RepID=A0A835XKW0_9CHLO|nr:hypothetical protein HYH03_018920 [Edaphochlamys debaryana]|eukprot:KAG2482134.1 hypothetical protein HYH03_018920 [Edaphochlamys debaryana]